MNILQQKINAGEWPIELPRGTIDIDQTIVLPPHSGGIISGQCDIRGAGGNWVQLPPSRWLGTTLRWTGATGSPMFVMGGRNFCIRDVAIMGPSVAFELVDKAQIGQGKYRFDSMVFQDCGLCFDIGDRERAKNLDDMRFYCCETKRVGTFVRVNHDMGMDYSVRDYLSQQTDLDFDFVRGGDLLIEGGAKTSPGKLIRIGDAGSNNGSFTVSHFKFDTQAEQTTVAEMTQVSACSILLDDVRIANDHYAGNNGRLVVLLGNSDVELRSCHGLQGGMVEWHGFYNKQRGLWQQAHVTINGGWGIEDPLAIAATQASTGPADFCCHGYMDRFRRGQADVVGTVMGLL